MVSGKQSVDRRKKNTTAKRVMSPQQRAKMQREMVEYEGLKKKFGAILPPKQPATMKGSYQDITKALGDIKIKKPYTGKKRGRKRKRGPRKGSYAAAVGAAKRKKEAAGIPPSPWKQEAVKKTRIAVANIRARQKAKIIEPSAVSYRYKAHLIEPERPFADDRGKYGHGVQSTAIVSFEYYPTRNLLVLIWWKDWKKGIVGSEYAYFDVPWNIYEGLIQASSKGRYVYYNIRTSFKYLRLSK